MNDITSAAATNTGLAVMVNGAETVLSWRWVRDHGEDESSFDPVTKQRRVYALDGRANQPAADATLAVIDDVPVIVVTWSDTESTWISQATVAALIAGAAGRPATPWHHASDTAATKGDVTEVVNDDDALAAWVRDIDTYGFAVLGGFSGGHPETVQLANRIGHPASTIFGTTWDLASDVDAHDDTAYTQTFLAPHTDGTYMHHAPGLQMFCCTERDGTGGESIIVDGFALAQTLRTEHPQDFEILTQVSVPGHYIEPGVELRTSRPAIRLDEHGTVVQISMNNYDRSPMLLPPAEMDAFYRAYGRLHELANDRSRWHAIRLEAGDVLINDNWRVLHGREAYTGARRFVGCYLNHSDLESRIRTLSI